MNELRLLMSRKSSTWIPTVIFWILFAGSIGLGTRFPWLDTVWYAGLLLFLLGISVICSSTKFAVGMVPKWCRIDPCQAGCGVFSSTTPRIRLRNTQQGKLRSMKTAPRVDYPSALGENN
jgi:hypothetical protein